MPQTSEITVETLLALYLKYHRIEWARTCPLAAIQSNDVIVLSVGPEFELRKSTMAPSILWHNGVPVT
jgi:hypothetical protein